MQIYEFPAAKAREIFEVWAKNNSYTRYTFDQMMAAPDREALPMWHAWRAWQAALLIFCVCGEEPYSRGNDENLSGV